MRGVFETRAGDAPAGREEWSTAQEAGGLRLKARGREAGEAGRDWQLDARFSPDRGLAALELQAAPADHASEVSTLAVRCFGGRAYCTRIGPEGEPAKLEAAFAPGSAALGFSLALGGLAAHEAPLKVGHGRRLLVVDMGSPALLPRVRDAMFLARSRERAPSPAGEGWATRIDFRWAESSGRTDLALVLGRAGVVLRAEEPLRLPPRTSRLIAFEG